MRSQTVDTFAVVNKNIHHHLTKMKIIIMEIINQEIIK